MTKAEIVDQLIALHIEQQAAATQIAASMINPVFQAVLATIGEEDKAVNLSQEFAKKLLPVSLEAQRQVYHELYSEAELYELLRFYRANTWFMERCHEAQRQVNILTEKLGEPLLQEIFQPFKFKVIKEGILERLEMRPLPVTGVVEVMGSEYKPDEISACCDELISEKKAKLENINGVPHICVNP